MVTVKPQVPVSWRGRAVLGLGGLLLGRELDCAHSCAPSSLWDTAVLAGFAIGTGRHPGVGVQAHPSIPGPAAIKSLS